MVAVDAVDAVDSTEAASAASAGSKIDPAQIFRDMEESLRDQRASDSDSTCDLDDPLDRGTVFYLPDGDVHICPGCCCPHAEYNDDRHVVCGLTGVVLGVELANETSESVTGRKPSNCPDDHAGEPVGGKWQPKKDMFGLSQQAYISAKTLDASTQYIDKTSENTLAKVPAKRGALCVDETPKNVPNKRTRVSKREVRDHEGYLALVTEASRILHQLVNYDKKPSGKMRNVPVTDERLCDADFLFGAAVKRYVKECLAYSTTPTLDAVHNLGVIAQNVAAQERAKCAQTESKLPKILSPLMKQLTSELVVSLWLASCKTSYMEDAKRGTDSFRPFACGVYYALKRGVALPDGRIVVPSLPPSFTAALPALRSTAAHSIAKTLHSSSHRGLCTLHRCVNAVSNEKDSVFLFDDAARRASDLVRAVKSLK